MIIEINDVKTRLKTFGYEATEDDEGAIEYLVNKVGEDILHWTNLGEVPEGLKYEWIDAVCGEFLQLYLGMGKLENVPQVVKSIREGDTTVTLAENMSAEAQLLTCIKSLQLSKSAMVRYRVMRW